MPFEPVTFLILVLLGGAVAVDGTSFGQFMISRPFVAATLAGAAVGDPIHGAAIGLVLEAFHLTVLPVGAARYPEGGPAGVAGGAVYATSDLAPSTLLLTVLLALLLEWLGGESIRYLRQFNVGFIAEARTRPLTASSLERRHVAAIGLDFFRGMVLVGGGAWLLWIGSRFLTPFWGFGEQLPHMMLTALVAGLFASAIRIVGWRAWFAAAGAIGGVGLLLLSA